MTTQMTTPKHWKADASKYLNATKLHSGPYAGRYGYFADETQTWYAVTDADLELLGEYLDRTTRYVEPSDCDYDCDDPQHEHGAEAQSKDAAYSHWCAATDSVEMPPEEEEE